MEPYKENMIEWLRGQSVAVVTITQERFKTRLDHLAKERPEECQIIARNNEGSIFAHVPVSWVKISPPREVSEELKQQARERMESMHADGLLSKSTTDKNMLFPDETV